MNPVIEISNLSKQYLHSEHIAVNQLSFSVYEKEIVGIIGPNGAGKTTLISMMCGLIKPSTGSIRIYGETYDNNEQSIRQNIGVVPQDFALYPTLTAEENLVYFGSMCGLKGKELKNTVAASLEKVGLLEFRNKKISTFSGGMKRRVNLLAGLLHQPKILFLDEPTVGVDIHSKKKIIDFLKEIHQNGTNIIYTSHHLLEAEELCTRILIVDNGKILTQGSPQQLIESTSGAGNLEDVFITLTGNSLRDVL